MNEKDFIIVFWSFIWKDATFYVQVMLLLKKDLFRKKHKRMLKKHLKKEVLPFC